MKPFAITVLLLLIVMSYSSFGAKQQAKPAPAAGAKSLKAPTSGTVTPPTRKTVVPPPTPPIKPGEKNMKPKVAPARKSIH